MDSPLRFRRALLVMLVGSVVGAAGLGILLVLQNRWGWFEIRVILTTIVIAVASVCGLACDMARTPRGTNGMPIAGLALTAIAALMILAGMWLDFHSEGYWKTTASAGILAVAAVHVSLLSLARLAPDHRWVLFVAWQIIFGLALLLLAMMWFEIEVDRAFRFVAALAILDAAVTLIIPILHRLGRPADAARPHSLLDAKNLASIDAEIARLKRQLAELERLKAELTGDVESAEAVAHDS
jgi:hypothetical protein